MADKRGSSQFGGAWTVQKLECIRRYLTEYTKILSNKRFRLCYIDAFAGTGYCSLPSDRANPDLFPTYHDLDAQDLIKGSARIALEIDPPFDEYIFIEKSGANCAELHALIGDYPELSNRITVLQGDANAEIQRLSQSDWRDRRAVMFLDPYGLQVGWNTLRSVSKTSAVDLWYLFPISAANRLMKRGGDITTAWRERLDLLLGTPEWYDAFYRTSEQQTLFGPSEKTEKAARFDGIARFVVERLASEFAGVAPHPRVLCNSHNSPLFLLCFAAANKVGAPIAIRIADHILQM